MQATIDRLAPTRRPRAAVTGTQSWRNLLFVHWEVDKNRLRSLLPPSLELDLWQGRAYAGVVPFSMFGVRPSWLPPRLAFDFLETNLRTYVTYRGEPGVWFFSLEAASWLAVKAARIGWSLPYYHARMAVEVCANDYHYRTERIGQPGAVLDCEFRVGPKLPPSELGTAEFFFLERYLLFSQRRGRIMRGQVYHTPYPARSAELLRCEEGLLAAAGLRAKTDAPAFVHYAHGVDVEVFGPNPT